MADDCHVKQIPSNFIYIRWPTTVISYRMECWNRTVQTLPSFWLYWVTGLCDMHNTPRNIFYIYWQRTIGFIFTPNNLLVILLAVYHTILKILIHKIWYWINYLSPNCFLSLFSSLVCLILYGCCKEKFCLYQLCEFKS